MPDAGRLVIRVDADERIGTGHAMRCLALAQGWRDRGGTVQVLSQALPRGLRERLLAEDVALEEGVPPLGEVAATVDSLAKRRGDWLVIDSPQTPAELLAALHERGHRIAAIDDEGRLARYACDVVLNQNLGAHEGLYEGKTGARLLLGSAFALLRRDLRQAPRRPQRAGMPRRLLILAGGSDPDCVSLDLIAAVRQGMEARLVIGPANVHAEKLRAPEWRAWKTCATWQRSMRGAIWRSRPAGPPCGSWRFFTRR